MDDDRARQSASFLASWRGEGGDARALDAALTEAREKGTAAWPTVITSPARFAAYLGERARTDADAVVALGELHADLYVACASAAGDVEAIRALDAALLVRVPIHLRRLRVTPEMAAETRQHLLERLFVASEGKQPRILQYRGHGALDGWVGVAAVRVALDLLANDKPRAAFPDDTAAIAQGVAPGGDPELELIKVTYRDEFAAAFREAMATLPARDRALLRFAFVERLTPARIGVVYGVHRTTVMRWLEAAQAAVLEQTRRRLVERLHLSTAECDGIFALVQSRLDVTLGSLLGTIP